MKVETIILDNEGEKKCKIKKPSIPHQCEQCGKSYARKNALQDHIAFSHQGIRKYECQECKRCFELATSYRKHLLSHTEFGLMFQCETCGHISKSKDNYETHKRKHTGEKPYVCELCSARFSCMSTLICHRKMHSGEALVMCTYCGKQISNKKNLKRHIAQKHSGKVKPENPYDQYKLKCQLCDGRFSKLSNLNRHIRNKHTDPPSDDETQTKKAEPQSDSQTSRPDQQNTPNTLITPNFHNFNSFLFPQHGHGHLFPQQGHGPLFNQFIQYSENQGKHEENKIQTNVTSPSENTRTESQHLETTDQAKGNVDSKSLTENNSSSPEYQDHNHNDYDDSDNHSSDHSRFDNDNDSSKVDSTNENEKSETKSFTDGNKPINSNIIWREEENIYAGDFLKEDDIKDEIKEEIESDELMDDDIDTDDYDCMDESESEEEEEEKVFKNETKVKEEAASKDFIKEEIKDSESKPKKKVTKILENGEEREFKEKKKRIRPKVKPSVNACQFCGKIFRFRNSMLRHERKHSGLRFECNHCSGSYTTKYHLHRHNCKAKEANPDYTLNRILCTQCGQGFTTNQSLREHFERQHGEGVAPLLCPDCGKGFYGKSSLKRHLKTACVSREQLMCSICAKEFQRKSALVNHMRSHQERPGFACSGCGTLFSNKRSMVNHIHQSHPELREEFKPPNKTEICNVCDLVLSSRRQLKQHKVDHHGLSYPYKCDKCGQGYVEKDTKLIKSHDSFCEGEIMRVGPMAWDEEKQQFKDTARLFSSAFTYQKRLEEIEASKNSLIQKCPPPSETVIGIVSTPTTD